MSSLSFVPSNALVAAFPQAPRRQISIRAAESKARAVALKPVIVPASVFEMSVAVLLSKGLHNSLPEGFIAARATIEFKANTRRLFVAGKFDRAAIMAAACVAAKKHQARYGSTRAEAMSVSLRAAWTVAKMAQRAAAN